MDGSDRPRRRNDADETTRRLLEAAAMEFVEHGYDKAVVSDIARRAGMTTGAVYARWPHKSDVMVAALDHIFEQILPEQRLKDLGLSELSAADTLAAFGTHVLSSDATQDVLVQVFGSARNNASVQARLKQFLDEQADQVSHIIERGKDEGVCEPELSTVALTLVVQAIGIGTHLLLSAGRDERHVPSEDEWSSLLVRLIATANPPKR